ncbi:MAG: bifunctional demethylmenaquinone methyltransferase/2-methoxy-6-polyprenyl-1,4-benzoquinol methylase UbiE [Chlamydiales bacterium]|nr:bifunctional demethylmenaquinone methyltransferase/2-methoxy-6-polyprenyl-1,4-benzoquinol methylase UbiE [Chlamydiales bacterium]
MDTRTKEPSRQEIWKMFDRISSTYDCINRVMTFGLDGYWRKKISTFLPEGDHLHLLDCATGTADQIIALMKHSDKASKKIARAVGIDLSEKMVALGVKKIAKKPYADLVDLKQASALKIPFADQTFDCVTISFGIRNVCDTLLALKEFLRVLKPGGRVLILEGTVPQNPVLKTFHLLYLRYLLPLIGGAISHQASAYRYLNETIETFPSGERFLHLMQTAGFSQTHSHLLTGGIVTIYRGDKKNG